MAKCSVVEDGTPCGKFSRGAAGLCCHHGGGKCRIEGCGKQARRAGQLCLGHVGECKRKANSVEVKVKVQPDDDAHEEGKCTICAEAVATHACENCNLLLLCEPCVWTLRRRAKRHSKKKADVQGSSELPPCIRCNTRSKFKKATRKSYERTGAFASKKLVAQAVSDVPPKDLLMAGVWFLQRFKMGDPLDKFEKVRFLTFLLQRFKMEDPAESFDVPTAADLCDDWCRLVGHGEKEDWQIMQMALSGCSGIGLPAWAKMPTRRDCGCTRTKKSWQRLYGLLKNYDQTLVELAVLEWAPDGHPSRKPFEDWQRLRAKRGDPVIAPDPAVLDVFRKMKAAGHEDWVIYRAAYRCTLDPKKSVGEYYTWAKPPRPPTDEPDALAETEEEALPPPEFPMACFEDAQVVSFDSLDSSDGPADFARMQRRVTYLEQGALEAFCKRLEDQGLTVDDDGSVDFDRLTAEQLRFLSYELDRALFFGQPSPLFPLPEKSTKLDEPPAKRGRMSEDESSVAKCPDVSTENAEGELEDGIEDDPDADVTAQWEADLEAASEAVIADVAAELEAEAASEADIADEIFKWLQSSPTIYSSG